MADTTAPQQPADEKHGLLRTTATWAAAAVAAGGIVYLAIIAVTYGASTFAIVNFAIWLVVIIWLLWLSMTMANDHQHVAEARDDAENSLTTAQDAKLLAEDALALVNRLAVPTDTVPSVKVQLERAFEEPKRGRHAAKESAR